MQKVFGFGYLLPDILPGAERDQKICLQTLGKIIEHDEKTDGDLLPTLRNLLDSNVNMKSTAESLFNTCKYPLLSSQ